MLPSPPLADLILQHSYISHGSSNVKKYQSELKSHFNQNTANAYLFPTYLCSWLQYFSNDRSVRDICYILSLT